MLTLVTITGNLIAPGGPPDKVSGGMTFQLEFNGTPASIKDSSTGQIVLPQLVQAVFKTGKLLIVQPGTGYGPLQLYANDDATTLPTGTKYKVTEQLGAGISITPWTLIVHHTVSTLTISAQRPVA